MQSTTTTHSPDRKSLFPVSPIAMVPVAGRDQALAIQRVFCVGRNYAAHAREMGKDPEREPPFFFTKWPQAYVANNSTIPYPRGTESFHYETELVAVIGRTGIDIDTDQALDHVFGYAVGLDMTRRDLQLAARDKGRPWDAGKNFEQSMPLGIVHPATDIGHPDSGRIWLEVNGEIRQDADISELIWSVAEIVSELSQLYRLEPGDLVMTGTPAGVGPVVPGDRLVAHVSGLSSLHIDIGPAI